MSAPVLVTTPDELASIVPQILGFYPTESVVFVAMRDGMVFAVGRTDVGDASSYEQGLDAMYRNGVDSAVIILFSAAPEPDYLADSVLPVIRAVPQEPTAAQVALAVDGGMHPLSSRDAVVAEFEPLPVRPESQAAAVSVSGIAGRDETWIAAESAYARDGAERMSQRAYGWLAAARESVQDETCAGAWFLAAWCFWRAGCGIRATCALDRLNSVDPDYSAAQLLRAALASVIDPKSFPALTLEALAQ